MDESEMLEDLWDDDGYDEPTFAPVSKHQRLGSNRLQTVTRAQPEVLFCSQFCSLSWLAGSAVPTVAATCDAGAHCSMSCQNYRHSAPQATAPCCRRGRSRAGNLCRGFVSADAASREEQTTRGQHAGTIATCFLTVFMFGLWHPN